MTLDMRTTVAPKSDQINADDLIGRTMTIKVTKVTGTDSAEQPVSIYFEGDNGKPYKPCKSMRRVLIHAWGAEASTYVGRLMTLYCDPAVKFGGIEVGGIRISHMSHIDKPMTMALTASKANKKPYQVKPLETPKEDPAVAKLKAAGAAAAAQGSDAYIAWKDSLAATDKEKIKPFHSGWSAEAKRVDEEAKAATPAEPDPLPPPTYEDDELPI